MGVADRPVYCRAIATPGRELPTDVGELAYGYGSLVRLGYRYRSRLSDERNRADDVEIHPDASERLAAVRRHLHPARRWRGALGAWERRPGDLQMHLLVGAVPANREQAFTAVKIDALRRPGEVRGGAIVEWSDARPIAAGSGHPHQVGRRARRERARRLLVGTCRSAHGYDPFAIRRPDRLRIGPVHRRHAGGVAACRSHAVDMAAVGLVPGHVGNRVARWRPGRHCLDHVVIGDPLRRAVRPVHHIQPIQRREGKLAAVRRRYGVADLPHFKLSGIIDRVFEREGGSHGELDIGRERHPDRITAVHRHTPDLAAVADHHLGGIGRERHTR